MKDSSRIETRTPARRQVALLAGRILEAIERGDVAGLKIGLHEAELCAPPCSVEPAAAERLELLAAVADRLRSSMARFERRVTPQPQGLTVYTRLLRHLAHAPPAATGPFHRTTCA